MRLFEEEICECIATDGPCEVLRVEERSEPVYDDRPVIHGYTAPSRWRTLGVVIYRAKTRMHPKTNEQGQWYMPESATETRLVLVRPSLSGTELPPGTGRYLGSFRQAGERLHAFLGPSSPGARPPAKSEAPKEGAARAPGIGDGRTQAPSGRDPRGSPPSGGQPSKPHNNAPPGRQ